MGSRAATRTRATRPSVLSARNALRQPAVWPSQVAAGTPTTAASELPPNRIEIARPRTRASNRLAAAGVTIDQNSAWLTAVSSRDPSSIQYSVTKALAAVVRTKPESSTDSRNRRGILRVSRVSGIEVTTTTRP